jgi:hypothetical protein
MSFKTAENNPVFLWTIVDGFCSYFVAMTTFDEKPKSELSPMISVSKPGFYEIIRMIFLGFKSHPFRHLVFFGN